MKKNLEKTDLTLEKQGELFRIIFPDGHATGWVQDVSILFTIYYNHIKRGHGIEKG